ncbi:hypothetical protein EAE91_23390 [Photorhabdus noenieputensis]|uniref:Abi family protein n=1 Tax=Photorhabdus TaxID=29487 RepID=UPI001BD30611|nr:MULTISPECIES: Abi family protein [Photorhabdus]MBS9439979.1 hypothetical protein [Photorhabdus noenieputensis]MBS9441306.1 hypothetical protein [Photorhabdus heterorhabditis]MCK3668843.1 Abi family protein [Photorhabdus noenieputensis]
MTVKSVLMSISERRISTYKRGFNTEDEAECLGLYIWNKRLCATFFPVLQLLEVSLRNSLYYGHLAYQRQKLIDSGLPPAAAEMAIDRNWIQHFYLNTEDNKFMKSREAVENALSSIQEEKREVTPDELIAKLTFGVWSNICSNHHKSDKQGSLKIWPEMIDFSFPGEKVTFKHITNDIKKLNFLRNRIAHHEPIWHNKKSFSVEGHINTVLNSFKMCLNLIKYINPSNLKTIVIMESIEQITQLCKKETIERFKQAAKDFDQVHPVDIEAWYNTNITETRLDGVIVKVEGKVVSIKAFKHPSNLFVLDAHGNHEKNLPHEIGINVNFEPDNTSSTWVAKNVRRK